jgi:high-affinity iron transporter
MRPDLRHKKRRPLGLVLSKLLALRLVLAALGVAVFSLPAGAAEDASASSAQTVWRLLDYIAVDYRGAVEEGRIISEIEYAEMAEFAGSVETRLADLPAAPASPALQAQAAALSAAIADKASADDVARIAHALAGDLLAAYPVPLAPSKAPDLARGAALYGEHCASCHGLAGHGDGAAAPGLDPPPVAFTDEARARERSVFGLYQVIGQGLEGTAMESYEELSPDDRWALAFYAGRFAYSGAAAGEGERLWTDDRDIRTAVRDLETLAQMTPASLAEQIGEKKARALTAYLRNRPDAVAGQESSPLALAKTRLSQSLIAYAAGDRRKATDFALSAYLDGVEPVEAALATRDAKLVREIEQVMIVLRDRISRNAPVAEVEAQIENATSLLDDAERALAPDKATRGASFAGAFTILLREGLEAMLIVVAMIAFLRKSGRTEAIAFVHGGWLAALAAGGLTWAAATYLISISGAGRELTEGIGSLTAAVVLVTVGVWMHGKSNADAWQKYIQEKMSRAMSRRSVWFLFLLAFIVVYREVFETILFYIALWSQGGAFEILLGAGLGALSLAAIAWALLRYSRRLPIGQFFLYSSLLIAVLAVVLAGKGVAALQEAGWLAVRPISALPRVEIIGLYPTWQGIAAQLLTLGVIAAAFWWNHRRSAAASAAS